MMARFHDKGDCAGFTLVEMIIASTLLSMMVFAVATLSISGAQAQEYARRLTRATEITQDIVDGIRLEMVSCVRVFGDDAEGNGNLAVIDFDGAPVPLGNQVLPTIDANGLIQQDTVGNQITGNSLFFTKLAWSDRFVCTSSREYLVDVYRWIYYYQTPEEGGPVPGSSIGLNLVRLITEPMVDGSAIDAITDPVDQAEVLMHLYDASADALGNTHTPCQVVWQRGGSPSLVGTFREINPADGSLSDDPLAASGRPNPWKVLRSTEHLSGLLSYRHHSVASNYAPTNFGVARYGVLSNTGAGFPHGFEVQVTGPSSARQVLLHLVVASTNRSGHVAKANMQVVVDARDL
jgi:prepilin-type N-terminal cleavage/methylation domain-containing protein